MTVNREPILLNVFGRGERIRTSDPSVPNRVLYQAEPRPDKRESYSTSTRGSVNNSSARSDNCVPSSVSINPMLECAVRSSWSGVTET